MAIATTCPASSPSRRLREGPQDEIRESTRLPGNRRRALAAEFAPRAPAGPGTWQARRPPGGPSHRRPTSHPRGRQRIELGAAIGVASTSVGAVRRAHDSLIRFCLCRSSSCSSFSLSWCDLMEKNMAVPSTSNLNAMKMTGIQSTISSDAASAAWTMVQPELDAAWGSHDRPSARSRHCARPGSEFTDSDSPEKQRIRLNDVGELPARFP